MFPFFEEGEVFVFFSQFVWEHFGDFVSDGVPA